MEKQQRKELSSAGKDLKSWNNRNFSSNILCTGTTWNCIFAKDASFFLH